MTINYTQKNKRNKQNGIKKTRKNGGGFFNWWNRTSDLKARKKELVSVYFGLTTCSF